MRRKFFLKAIAGVALVFAAGCKSLTLISANSEFIDLVTEMDRLEVYYAQDQSFGERNYQASVEGLRSTFRQNGVAAVEAANDSSDAGDKVSFLNLALRNYLKAGPLGEGDIPQIAEEGERLCASPELQGLNALPTTCAYFGLVAPQAISNQQNRIVLEYLRKVRDPSASATVEDGKALQRAYVVMFDQAAPLKTLLGDAIVQRADEGFREAVLKQQEIIFCNAEIARLSINERLPDAGSGWDRDAASDELKQRQGEFVTLLNESLELGRPHLAENDPGRRFDVRVCRDYVRPQLFQ